MEVWAAQMNLIENSAKSVLDAYSVLPNRDDFAIVFDIDDTLISVKDFSITPIINLYKYAKELGYFVVIITARADGPGSRDYTLLQLTQYTIPHPHLLYLRPPHDDPEYFKTGARSHVQNYHRKQVMLSIGDSKCDVGDYGGIGFLVPRIL